jgi:hypothetical protein
MCPEWCQLDNVAEDKRKFVKLKPANVLVKPANVLVKPANVLVKPEPPPPPPSTVRCRVVGCA